MQSIACAAPSVSAIVWIKRQSIPCWDSQVAHSTTRNDASPGSSGLSHILPCSVTLPVDSLLRRQESVARDKEDNKSWVHAVLIVHILQWLATKSAYTKHSVYQHRQNVRTSKPKTCYILNTALRCILFSPFKHLLKKMWQRIWLRSGKKLKIGAA